MPRENYLDPDTITCDSAIVASAVDPRLFTPVFVAIASWRPIRVVLIYNGSPPDFTDFFNKGSIPLQLGPQQQFSKDTLKLAGRAWAAYDDAYEKIVLNRQFTWRSFECNNFTFTIVEEI